MAKTLTKREAIFVNEYLIDFNATRAAKSAGYSAKTATQAGSRLLKTVKVKNEIECRVKGALKKVEDAADASLARLAVTGDNIITSLAEMGLAHKVVGRFLKTGSGGNLYYDFTGATAEELVCIQPMIQEIAVEQAVEGTDTEKRTIIRSRIKFVDRKGVLELLGRYNKIKLWSDVLEVKNPSEMTPEQRKDEMRRILNDALMRGRVQ